MHGSTKPSLQRCGVQIKDNKTFVIANILRKKSRSRTRFPNIKKKGKNLIANTTVQYLVRFEIFCCLLHVTLFLGIHRSHFELFLTFNQEMQFLFISSLQCRSCSDSAWYRWDGGGRTFYWSLVGSCWRLY